MINISQQDIFSLPISHYQYCWASAPLDFLVSDALEIIKGESLKGITLRMRKLLTENPDGYACSKRKLPCVTFCASFLGERRKENIASYNRLMILDIDKVDQAEMTRIKNALRTEETIFAFWESPSGNGIKGLVPLHYEFEIASVGNDVAHKMAFKQIAEYLKVEYFIKLDEQGSDFTRLCFLSSDQNIVIKANCTPFTVRRSEILPHQIHPNRISYNAPDKITRNILYNPLGKNDLKDKITIKKIIRFLTSRNLSITHDYDDWLRVGFALANTFTYDLASKYFHELSKMDPSKYNEYECSRMLINCYEHSYGKISFRTVKYLAESKGFKLKKSDTESTSPVPAKQENRYIAT